MDCALARRASESKGSTSLASNLSCQLLQRTNYTTWQALCVQEAGKTFSVICDDNWEQVTSRQYINKFVSMLSTAALRCLQKSVLCSLSTTCLSFGFRRSGKNTMKFLDVYVIKLSAGKVVLFPLFSAKYYLPASRNKQESPDDAVKPARRKSMQKLL